MERTEGPRKSRDRRNGAFLERHTSLLARSEASTLLHVSTMLSILKGWGGGARKSPGLRYPGVQVVCRSPTHLGLIGGPIADFIPPLCIFNNEKMNIFVFWTIFLYLLSENVAFYNPLAEAPIWPNFSGAYICRNPPPDGKAPRSDRRSKELPVS